MVGEFAENGWVNIVGGCCGTTPAHIRAIAEAVREARAAPAADGRAATLRLSGTSRSTLRPDSNFMMIGERTNVTGSKKFARLIKSEQVRRSRRRGPRSRSRRRQRHRRQHGRSAARRRSRDDASFCNLIAAEPRHRRRADHGRQLEVVGDRGGPEVRAGQGDRQLDQPEGRRGGVPAPGAAGAAGTARPSW